MAGKYLMRRRVVQMGAAGVGGTLLAGSAAAAVPEIDTGKVQGGRVEFPAWTAPTERPSGGPPNPLPVNERVGFAVVGLGRLALEEVLPAFGEAKKFRLVALVSGTPDKAARVAAEYGVRPDVGLYCLNAARFLTGEEPIEVIARTTSPPGDPRYAEVEETVNFMLRFPSGVVANCATSYGMHESRLLRVHTPAGAISLDGAFAYDDKQLRVAHRDGRAESVDERRLPKQNQFALEMDHMADCVTANRQPHTPGEEGVQDHRVMEAIYQSAASGQPVAMPRVDGLDRTRGPAPASS